jgi:TonB-linked SusC/RagA family outer membrane protein
MSFAKFLLSPPYILNKIIDMTLMRLAVSILPVYLLLLSITVSAQQRTISGKITNRETGLPMEGVSVNISGTTVNTISDSSGNFSISLPAGNPTLIFSYVGFGEQQIKAGDSTFLSISMSSLSKSLNEVVVIGYGTVKRRDLTGSVASVKAEDLVRIPTQNPLEAIQGRVPGADIVRSSGAPGSGVNITVRGNKSITTNRDELSERNRPLIIIDGFQGGDINSLNPADIESIDVLKDASSTAIYGAQGGNGVIIVTTKKGSSGQAKVSYAGYYGVTNYRFPASRIGADYVKLRREAARTTGEWNSEADDPRIFDLPGEYEAVQAGQWVNWVDLLVHNGRQQNHVLSVTGGSARTKIFASAGYFNEKGMLNNEDYKRYNTRFNLDQTINAWLKAGLLSQLTYSIQNTRNNPLSQASSTSPLGVPYDQNGMVNIFPIPADPSRISPLADERSNLVARDNNLVTNVAVNGYIELSPIKDLKIRSSLAANLTFNRRGIYNDRLSLARYSSGAPSLASSEQNYNRFLNWDNIVTYTKEINDHSFVATGIISYLQSDRDQTHAEGIGQLLPSQLFYDLSSTQNAAGSRVIRSPYEGWNNLAYAGRINYSYKSKYLLTLTGRWDGASRLSATNRWDFFPSAAVAWNMSDEEFMKNVTAVENLKLRASYGVSGNYNIPVYGTQSLLTNYSTMGFGDVAAPAYYFSGRVTSPNLGWERSATLNIGVDLSILKDRIAFTIDAYKTTTSDILLPRPLPLSSGVTEVYENIAKTENKGIEFSINSQNIRSKELTWSSTVTFSSNRERITELLNGTDILATSGVERNSLLLGHPISSFYTYKKLGIWQSWEDKEAATYRFANQTFQPGDIKLADLQPADPVTGLHTIDANDMTYIGSTVPKFVIGFQNNFKYKAFDLNLYLFARVGQTIDAEFLGRYNPAGTGNGPAIIDYWTPENPTNDFPRPRRGSTLSNYPGYQTLNFVNGSFFKIRTLTLGYTLPEKLGKRLTLNTLRVYATASNLLTITKSDLIKDYDPERGGSESSPLSRQFVFGINLNF